MYLIMVNNNNWRENIEPYIKDHLELIIEGVHKHKKSYKNSKNPSAAQLWCALAIMSKQIFDLNLKIKLLEKVVKENTKKPSNIKDVPNKDESEDLMKIAANPKKSK